MIDNVSDITRYETDLREAGSRVETLTPTFLHAALTNGWTGVGISEYKNIPLEVVLGKMNEYGLSVFDKNIREMKGIGIITHQKTMKHVLMEIMTGDMMGRCHHCDATGPVDIFHIHHTIKYTDCEFGHLPKMPPNSRAWDVMMKEIEICTVLCGNCHSNLHSVYPSPQSLIEVASKPYWKLHEPQGIVIEETIEEDDDGYDYSNVIQFPLFPETLPGNDLDYPV